MRALNLFVKFEVNGGFRNEDTLWLLMIDCDDKYVWIAFAIIVNKICFRICMQKFDLKFAVENYPRYDRVTDDLYPKTVVDPGSVVCVICISIGSTFSTSYVEGHCTSVIVLKTTSAVEFKEQG